MCEMKRERRSAFVRQLWITIFRPRAVATSATNTADRHRQATNFSQVESLLVVYSAELRTKIKHMRYPPWNSNFAPEDRPQLRYFWENFILFQTSKTQVLLLGCISTLVNFMGYLLYQLLQVCLHLLPYQNLKSEVMASNSSWVSKQHTFWQTTLEKQCEKC